MWTGSRVSWFSWDYDLSLTCVSLTELTLCWIWFSLVNDCCVQTADLLRETPFNPPTSAALRAFPHWKVCQSAPSIQLISYWSSELCIAGTLNPGASDKDFKSLDKTVTPDKHLTCFLIMEPLFSHLALWLRQHLFPSLVSSLEGAHKEKTQVKWENGLK